MENFTLIVENKGIVILCQNISFEIGPYKGVFFIENASLKNALYVMDGIYIYNSSQAVALHLVRVSCLAE